MSSAKSENPAKPPAKPATARRARSSKTAVKPVAVPEPAPVAPPKPTVSRTKLNKIAETRTNQARKASVMLKFVSDPTRLQVILSLADAEHHVGALCEQLGQSQPAVSHHLALLRHGGIIIPRRQGKNNFYSLSSTGAELAKVLKLLLQVA